MTLEDLGYTKELEHYRKDQNLDSFEVGRVISEHKKELLQTTRENIEVIWLLLRLVKDLIQIYLNKFVKIFFLLKKVYYFCSVFNEQEV